MDLSNTPLLDEMLVNLLLMLSGVFFSSAGGDCSFGGHRTVYY